MRRRRGSTASWSDWATEGPTRRTGRSLDRIAVGTWWPWARAVTGNGDSPPPSIFAHLFRPRDPAGMDFPGITDLPRKGPLGPRRKSPPLCPIRTAAWKSEAAGAEIDRDSAGLGAERRCHHRSVVGDAEAEGGIGRGTTFLGESPLARAEEIPQVENRARTELRP